MKERGNPWLRWLDRRVGIPIVGLLAARRIVRRARPASPRRVGVLQTSGIGDTVLLSAVAQDLARRGCEVIMFTGGENAAAARLVAGVSRVVPLALTRPWRAAAQLRAEPLDAVLDGGTWPRINAVLCASTNAHTVGFRTPKQHRHFAHDTVVDHRRDVHELENFRALVRALGIEPESPPALAERPDGEVVPIPEGPYVVFHAWPGGFMGWRKEWPETAWRDLGAHLAASGARVLISGSPADVPRAAELTRALRLPERSVENVAGRFSLRALAAVLRHAELVVSVNTGVMHLAAVQGVPTISLEGPTAPERWGPIGPRAHSVRSTLDGCGFLHLGWEYAGTRADCMQGVDPARVAALADAVRAPAPRGGWTARPSAGESLQSVPAPI